ncbi:MAG: glutamyl-tRNA reductase [bacterium]|nr:glutamyl-tRNA reductase [bacterium]
MSIVIVGLNYRTAPIEIRETLSLAGHALHAALHDLKQAEPPGTMEEAAILSTCNRLEVVVSTADPVDQVAAGLRTFLARVQGVAVDTLAPHLVTYSGDEAVEHLMRVACGLDSMILGETQILGQVTEAYETAQRAGVTGAVLSHLFAQAIHAGKRAHTETPISRHTTSVSHAGARLLIERFAGLHPSALRVLVIGAGEMAGLAAAALHRHGVTQIGFINRTHSRAETMAAEVNGRAFAWIELNDALTWADAAVCATGAPHTLLHRHDLDVIMPRRAERPLVLIDLAVPRDVEESVRTVAGVALYDIDDLQSVVDANLELRKAALPQAAAIIHDEMRRFAEWYHGRQVTPVIRTLREWAQTIADEELAHTLNRLGDADDHTREVVSRMAQRLVNRLLHQPTSRLRLQASEGNGHGYAHAVRELFALEGLENVTCEPARTDGGEPDSCGLACILPAGTGR